MELPYKLPRIGIGDSTGVHPQDSTHTSAQRVTCGGHEVPSGFVGRVVARQSNTERLTVDHSGQHVWILSRSNYIKDLLRIFRSISTQPSALFQWQSEVVLSHLSSRLYWF